MSDTPSPHLLTIDFGTSGIKVMLWIPSGEVRALRFTSISYQDSEGLANIGKEFDAISVWKIIAKMIRANLSDAGCASHDVIGVAATSQRLGGVFLDERGKAVYAGPNLDARGVFVQDIVAQQLEETCPPTGCWPPLIYQLCRLLWFKQEKPEQYARIHHVLSISDWIVFQLTNEITTDPSQASNTQFMDIRTSTWSPEILEMADISADLLPPIRQPGTLAGTITAKASKITGLQEATPVAVGGGDTQCALLGSATMDSGSVCVVAGNTAPIQLVMAQPIIDKECRVWTGRHLLPNRWVLEANTGATGSVLSWFVHNLVTHIAPTPPFSDEAVYTRVEQLAASADVGSLDTIALLGPQVMDARDLTTVRPAVFVFPPPASPVVTPISLKELARALFENICYAVRTNLELLQIVSESTFESCTVAGGLVRSQLWRQMLADVTGLEVRYGTVFENSSLGAAICATCAAGLYESLEDAVERMVPVLQSVQPQPDLHRRYEIYFSRWKTLYNQLVNL